MNCETCKPYKLPELPELSKLRIRLAVGLLRCNGYRVIKDGSETDRAIRNLVDAVEQYVEPKPGTPYLHRSALLKAKNDVKAILK